MVRPREGLRRVPDLLFISNQRLPALKETVLQGGPDLAVEVISRGSRKRDRVEKFAEYQAAGVGEYWIIDPKTVSLDAYALGAEGRYEPLPIEDGILRSRVVAGFWIRVEWLWQRPFPSTLQVLRELGIGT